jgi:hypothetical protein
MYGTAQRTVLERLFSSSLDSLSTILPQTALKKQTPTTRFCRVYTTQIDLAGLAQPNEAEE